ncbi:MAG TPA: GspE/PulE family protein [Anaerohalosphaeraceae bacterium]|nr:type II/IV secretion system protein [Phycisphaerae bacterium]HOM74940.1 GspE/PulE family protein [Anaerohalosphaeraceae bacterium]HPC64925.1 GspE/PulE family protein [Anaerohalosphaeraceae bacterium]HPO68743.1 GspE/PulE family protein [Anaerohalosphaeraceae bacterium]HRS70511.1 GspE/PulE family protein [Anaerohalosphaeraceae bacterium]
MNQTSQPNVAALVEQLLSEAIRYGASDVHFEPTAKSLLVKFRLDGSLNTVETLPKAISENIIARLKVLAGLLTYRNDIPQEGRMEGFKDISVASEAGTITDLRLAVFPTIYGQRAVVRIFYENRGLMQLDELGLNDFIESALRKFACRNQGILLLTGPAGSGKSTTLAALLRYILQQFPGNSIVTLEDPVERAIEGITQVQIEPQGQMSFPMALRSLLRQDPQVLMIGEIRDAETARIAVEAGLTGHLLMTTMHSGSCSGALLRLLEMGIEPYQVTSGIHAVLNQRLVRKLCDSCKRQLPDGAYEAVGCSRCHMTGYHGRVLIAEMVELDGMLRKAILDRSDMETLDAILASRGHMNLMHDGRRLVSRGITTEDEIRRVCGV